MKNKWTVTKALVGILSVIWMLIGLYVTKDINTLWLLLPLATLFTFVIAH